MAEGEARLRDRIIQYLCKINMTRNRHSVRSNERTNKDPGFQKPKNLTKDQTTLQKPKRLNKDRTHSTVKLHKDQAFSTMGKKEKS
jgi:hypothetical protein